MSNIDNTYSISNDLDELEEEARNATRENFTAARDYVLGLLHRNGYQAALLGGYSLALRGSPRATYDIDVAVLGGVTMRHVQNIIQNDPRQVPTHMKRACPLADSDLFPKPQTSTAQRSLSRCVAHFCQDWPST